MSRSFRELLKFSVPLVASAALLSGCGSGGGGSADLDEGGSVPTPPAPVANTETFDFDSVTSWFVSGTPPTHARFSGGEATDTGAGYWIIPEGETGVVEFGTPADAVQFSTQDDFTPTAGAAVGAQKTTVRGGVGAQAVKAPFDVAMYVRGSMNDWLDGGVTDQYKLTETAENVLAVSLDLAAGAYVFKIANAGYNNGTNCGMSGTSGAVTLGAPYALNCADGSGDLTITLPAAAKYKFTLDVNGDPTLTVAEDTGNGGGGEPEPEEDSTIIRIHSVRVVATRDGPAGATAVEEQKGLGSLSVNVARKGGEMRVYKIEIENTGSNGDIGIADFSWTADAQFALQIEQVDVYYLLPEGSADGMTIVIGGKSYPCDAPPAGSPYSCVARDVEVTPYANDTMTVKNADGSTRDTIIFNGGGGAEDVFAYSGSTYANTGTPATPPAIAGASAHWVTAGTLLYSPPAGSAQVELLYSPNASIAVAPDGFAGTYQTIALSSGTNPQPAFNKQLHNLPAWSLGAAAANARDIARGQLVAVGRDAKGTVLGATYVQTPGAIDDLYAAAADEPLGVSYASGVPSLAVWAPTALTDPGVRVNVYDAGGTMLATEPMTLDETTGIWRVTGTADWDRKFYTISLRVYSPHYASNAMVDNEVTDPYSVSLATDSVRSQFVNLDDADLKPTGWDTLTKPALAAPEDIVIYELHVRDFSVADPTVAAIDNGKHVGKFTAFDLAGTDGRDHLQQLANDGLTHVHILPAFDIATIKEDPDDRVDIDDPVEDLCAANSAAANLCVTDAGKKIRKAMEDAVASGRLELPQQIVNWMRQVDGFNWGYDPYHFGAPEGSYSTDPNGETRIREFRRMVKGLNELGLRTVMDVVYNHTNASGQNARSVLDKMVPGYYHRRFNDTGLVIRNTCCDDTASEFRMMEKLMVDTGKTWVRDYKVSGFRFDLSGFHTLDNMLKFKTEVEAIDPSVYIYGEAWNYGEVVNDARFTQARQANLGGTGIGSFSDRIRDPIRGGGPFDGGIAYVKNQGFINGWYYDPNSENTGGVAERQALITATDNIRVWLAGGLEDYQLQNAAGATVTAAGVDYAGQPSGYTEDPSEGINYAEKHDNQTLWDYSAYKHPDGTSLANRVRAHNVGLSLVLLGQGVPFLHAGSEILRSKSGDRDSYDSGDWFNELDWSLSGTKWAQGLPVDYKNEPEWPILESKFQTVPRPDNAAQQRAFDHVREMLRIRKSSTLFRLREAAQVQQRVKFYNTGPSQVPGVIAMAIDGCTNPGEPVPDKGAYMTVFNASDTPQTLNLFASETWTLHPVLAASTDAVVKTAKHDAGGFYVPARTTAVFQRVEQKSCAPFPVEMFVRGSFNDWGNNAATLPNYQLQFLGGTQYSVSAAAVTMPDTGLPQFKIADANWVAATNCGATAPGQTVLLGQPSTLRCADGTPNLSLGVSAAGSYTFSLNAASTLNPVLTVTRTSPSMDKTVFVRGLFGDWGTTRPMAWDGERIYTATITATAASSAFKIATDDWATLNCGGPNGANDSVTLGQPYPLVCGDGTSNLSVSFPSLTDYVFAVDGANPSALTLTVESKPVDVFVRGINGDWSDGAQNRMSYLGLGTYRIDRAVAAGPTPFKIASSDWATVNCGWPTTGQEVAIGTPFTMNCPAAENLNLNPVVGGTYRFKYTTGDNGLLVTGP